MPIYAYKCGSCGHAKDVLQKMSADPLTTCPACGAEAFTKQLTAASFQLKGSGWYVTDFRDGNSGAKGAAESTKDGEKSKESGSSEKANAPAVSGSEAAATPTKAPAAAPAPAAPVAASPSPAPKASS